MSESVVAASPRSAVIGAVGRPWTGNEPAKLLLADLNHLLLWAKDAGASDIVLLSDAPPAIRLHGEFHRVANRRLSTPEIAELLNDVRGAANASAQLIGADSLDFSHSIQRTRDVRVRYRVNATAGQTEYTGSGIELVFRAIPEAPPSVTEIGVEEELLEAHREVARSQGLFLVVGATGTGKTTLLAALLRDVLETPPGRHLITYEAPIEFDLSAVPKQVGIVVQTEVPRHIRSFSEGVVNAMRRAPNIILVGESRDIETVKGTITASTTGHAVYSTLHATSVAGALPRLIGEFPEVEQPAILARVLAEIRCIVTQRLVPRVGGGRVALREFLRFTQSMRLHLAQVPRQNLQPEVHALVEKHGQSLLKDARKKFALALIDDVTMRLIEAELSTETQPEREEKTE